ncbi:MAG: O-antigen ligase family protein [Ruminococcus sp.]|nr:O-antigen ligase family protein [Ruminococcus sp.]
MSTVKKKLNEIAELITTEKAFYWLIMITMISLPIFELLTEQHERNFEGQPIIVEAAGIMGVVMVVTHLLKNRNKSSVMYPTTIIYFCLILFAGLSLAFSEDQLSSVQGYDYDEWLTHFMAYFSLMYAGTMIKDTGLRKNIFKAFIFVLIIQGVIGALQSFGFEFTNAFFDGDKSTRLHLAYGLTAHFNWYSALMTLAAGCAMGLCIFAENAKRFWIFFALTALGVYAMLSTETRLTIVSFGVFVVFYPISLIVYQLKKKDGPLFKRSMLHFGAIALLIVGMTALFIFGLGRYKTKIDDTLSEIGGLSASSQSTSSEESDNSADESAPDEDTSSEEADGSESSGLIRKETGNGITWNTDTEFDKFASYRGHIWKYGLDCVPSHWAFGVGLDNYRWCFSHAPHYNQHTWSQGKGHNELIHYLVTQGVFQLLTILVLWGYTIVIGIRTVLKDEDKENRTITWVLLGMFVAYIAQSMFNSSVVNIAPYYWITMGCILSVRNTHPFGYRKSLKAKEQEDV